MASLHCRLARCVAPMLLVVATCAEDSPATTCTVEETAEGTRTVRCSDGVRVDVRDGPRGAGCTIVPGADGAAELVCGDGTRTRLPSARDGESCTLEALPGGDVRVRCGEESFVLEGAADGSSCTVVEAPDGPKLLRCGDGTEVVLEDGAPGASCTVRDNGDGTHTITCEDGSTAIVGDGPPGGDCTVRDDGAGRKTIRCDDGTEVAVSDGRDGASCTARDNGDGTRTISCGDGTRVDVSDGRDGTSCTVTDEGDGTYTLACTDGTSVEIRPAGAGVGAIEGTVRLVGRTDHAGTVVSVEGLALETSTDATGTFRLTGIPAGIHAFSVAHDGFAPVRLENVPILPGTFETGELSLRRGRRLASGDAFQPVAIAPDRTALLYLRDRRVGDYPGDVWGELVHLDLVTGSSTSLGGAVECAAFGRTSAQVLFARTWDAGAMLSLADVSTGQVTPIAARVRCRWTRAGSGDGLFVHADVDGGYPSRNDTGILVHVDLTTGVVTTVADAAWPDTTRFVRGDGALAFLRTVAGQGTDLAVWDAATGTTAVIASGLESRPFAIHDGGRWAAARSSSGDLIVADLELGAAVSPGSSSARLDAYQFDARGGRLAYQDGAGDAILLDLTAAVPVASARGVPRAFDPAGERLLIQDGSALMVWDPAAATTVWIGSSIGNYTFSPDGRFALFYRRRGYSSSDPTDLVGWDVAAGREVVLGADVASSVPLGAAFSPDGSRAVLVVGYDENRGLGDLVEVDLSTGLPTVLDSGAVPVPAGAHDPLGRWLLYGRFRRYPGGPADVHVRDLPAGTGFRVSAAAASARFGETGLAWILGDWSAETSSGTLTAFDAGTGEATILDVSVAGDHVASGRTVLYARRILRDPERDGLGLFLTELP